MLPVSPVVLISHEMHHCAKHRAPHGREASLCVTNDLLRTGRPIKATVTLPEDQRAELEECAHGSQGVLALRARILLACAEGKPNKKVAEELRVTQQTVIKWRDRYLSKGPLTGLLG